MKTQKILLLAGRYGLSGVPLAQLRLARVLAGRGHTVKLVYGMLNEGIPAPVADGLDIEFLGRARVSAMVLPLVGVFKNFRPDIVFSAGDHLSAITLIAARLSGTNAKISCSSRVTPYDTYSDKVFSKGWVLKQVMRAVMPRADVLTCVSKDMVDQYRRIFPGSRHVCVYNIIGNEGVPTTRAPRGEGHTVIAAGALEPWKGFADLIDAMAIVVRTADARLTILGEGSERAALQARIDALGLSDRVTLRGNVIDPLDHFARADTFVLSSLVEGLPNVLVEAMLCGCTPVATDCPTGPREVLQDGRYGTLVPVNDPAALAAGILTSFAAPIAAQELAEAVKAFSVENVLERHAALLGVDGL